MGSLEVVLISSQEPFRPGRVFRIGFAVFIVSLFGPLYNSYVPLFLDRFFEDQLPKNFIMTIDNFLALTVIPLFAFLSDRTNSRFGRRKPYIFVGTAAAALLYIVFPQARFSLVPFMAVLFSVNMAIASFRAPALSLMPDLVPPENRSQGNGIITVMIGLAGLLVFLVGSVLYKRNPAYPFYFTSVLMLASLIPLWGLKEPQGLAVKEQKKPLGKILKELRSKNLMKLMLPNILWGMGFTGVEATLSNHFTKFLDMPPHLVTIPTAAYALTAIAASVPAGYLSHRIGKKNGLMLGLAGITLMFVLNGLVGTVLPYSFLFLCVASGLLGIFGAVVGINSFPLAVEDIAPEEIGSYTGLYYFMTNFHPILGPLLLGAVIDIMGFKVTYFYGALGHLAALIIVIFLPFYEVKRQGREKLA